MGMYDLGESNLLTEETYPLEATYSAKGKRSSIRPRVDNAHAGGGPCFRGGKNPTSPSC